MAERQINPILKQVLELGPTVAFFVLYICIKDETFTFNGSEYSGFIVATVAFIPVLLGSTGVLWALTGKLSRLQIFTAFMVIFFGGLTAWFNDERFFKMKTTIVHSLMAGLLGIGLLRGESWLKALLGEVVEIKDQGWMTLTRGLCAAFAGLAVLNEIIWRTQSDEVWVALETFAFPILLVVVFFYLMHRIQDQIVEPKDD